MVESSECVASMVKGSPNDWFDHREEGYMGADMSRSVRVACIGTGYFSQFHYDAWNRIESAEPIASVSLCVEQAKETGLSAYDNVEAMLAAEKPDLVDIITPPASHLNLISLCAQRGVKTIICQKPFCNSLEEARQAVSLCEASGTNLIVHENFRFQPWYRAMKNVIDAGLLGDVHQMTFRLRTGDGQGSDAYLARQPYFQKMERFLLHETGVHWIDTFCYLLGRPKAVYADLRQLNPAIAGEDAGYFIMEFDDGKRAMFDGNRLLDHDAENCRTTLGEALLEGTRGTVSLKGNGELTHRVFGSQSKNILLPSQPWQGFGGDCVIALQSHVIDCLLEDRTDFENRATEYLKVLEIEDALYRSAQVGRKIAL